MADQTVSIHDARVLDVVGGPCLIRAFRCDRPLLRPARIALGGTTAVLGRGELSTTTEGATIHVRVPDDGMSTVHAQISQAGGKPILEDCGSKNGTLLNGVPCTRAELDDGDVIETGHTFFVFRARVASDLGTDASVFAADPAKRALPLVTIHAALARQFETLARIAPSTLSAVILGDTGTGKEVVARALHRLSGRAGAFIAVNCGAIPGSLIESEMFGVKKGAFSGATEDRPGLIRAADGGTLFLDEIGELPAPAQVTLLRVLQEQEVVPIGGVRPIPVDVRLVTATHRPLETLVETSSFRSDLYARLSGLNVRLPALRERREDLGLIIAALVERIAAQPDTVRFSRLATRAIFAHPFARNIRELEKALRLAVAIAGAGSEIDLEHLPENLQSPVPAADADDDPEDDADSPEDAARKTQLIDLLVANQGRVAAVAREMGKARMQIHRWIQRYKLDLASYRKE